MYPHWHGYFNIANYAKLIEKYSLYPIYAHYWRGYFSTLTLSLRAALMTLTPIRIVIAYGSRLFRMTICSFLVDRFFSNKTGRAFLSGWVLIFCLCASAIAGGDDRPANVENAPVYSLKDDSWILNVPTVITLAPGIYFIPDVGYYYMDDAAAKEQGHQWYIGVKWQIDF